AHAGLVRAPILNRMEPIDPHVAAIRSDQAGENPEQCRLAGAVAPGDDRYGSGPQLESDIVENGELPPLLREPGRNEPRNLVDGARFSRVSARNIEMCDLHRRLPRLTAN